MFPLFLEKVEWLENENLISARGKMIEFCNFTENDLLKALLVGDKALHIRDEAKDFDCFTSGKDIKYAT